MSTPAPHLRRARLGVNILFLTNGALFANLLPRYPMVKDLLGVDATIFGLLVACFPFGAMIAGLTAGKVIRRFSSATTAMVGTYVVAIALLIASLALEASPFLFALAMFVGGGADAIVDVGQNAHGMRVQRGYGRSIINSFHAAWSAGAVIGGLMGSAATGLKVALHVHLGVSGVMFCAAAYVAGRLALPGPDTPEIEEHEDAGANVPSYRSALLIMAALSIVALSGTFVEDAGSTWSALFLRDIVGATGGIVGLGYVAMVAAQFVGRMTGDRFTDRYGARAVARVGAFLIATGMTLMLLWPNTATTLSAFALAGFGCATLVPAAFDAADRIPGLPEGTGLTMIGWTMRLAFLSGPPLVGLITDAVGLRIGLAIVPLGAIALVFASRVLPRRAG
ncbi:MFS transporter [Bowdeniella nasicola]|uniref:MFS transporter n=1 Tax=Bowdeniella nasicola TaxID=208480 RepID=A0A1Q5PZ91_9ACTO|nr:MFS transporter [Bowdeniella nasicola]OKL52934.1 MFS transporter [Bowdeniella nasicola]